MKRLSSYMLSILVAGGMVSMINPAHAGNRSVSVNLSAGEVTLRQGGLQLPVSLDCPVFITDRGTLGIDVKLTNVEGKITGKQPIQVTFAPIPLADSGQLVVKQYLQWSSSEKLLRKWASYQIVGTDKPVLVKEIILDDLELSKLTTKLLAKQPLFWPYSSYPVFFDGFFTGVEFPTAITRIDNNHVIIGHNPGLRMSPGVIYETRKAVYGICKPGDEWQNFKRYIDSNRPEPKGRFINYNHWWSTPPRANEADILGIMEEFRKNLYVDNSFSFDSFCIDCGWPDTKTVWEMDKTNFPDGFTKVQEAASRIGTDLGIWISPSSCYEFVLDSEYARAHGYEAIPTAAGSDAYFGLCLGGKRYHSKFRREVVDMVTRWDLKSIKFDGYIPTCTAVDHGHEPGALSAEVIATNMIDVFLAARRANPDVWLRPTCFGYNPSPWWLFYTNSVLGIHGDDSPYGRVPCPNYRESFTTAKDFFNLQGAAWHPISMAAEDIMGLNHQTDEPFMNDLVSVIMRGNDFIALYLNPKYMGGRRWEMLSDAFKWSRKNADILGATEPLLPVSWQDGRCPKIADVPMPREPYGYIHCKGRQGLVYLRNPWIATTSYTFKLDAGSGLSSKASGISAVSLYPEPRVYGKNLKFGDTIQIQLAPYETLVLSLKAGQQLDGLPDVSGTPNRYVKADIRRSDLTKVEFDTSEPAFGPSSTSLMGDVATGVRLDLDAKVTVDTPDTEILILMEGNKSPSVPVINLTINEKAQAMTDSISDTGWTATVLPAPEHWTFMRAPLSKGLNAVSLELMAGSDCEKISAWVWAKKPGNSKPHPYPNVLPEPETISIDGVCLLEPVEVSAIVSDIIKTERPTEQIDGVFLDTMEPASITQGWGTLQKNKSVWEKPIVIAGKHFQRGLGTTSQTKIVYTLDGKFRRFQSWVGADWATSPSVAFEVWVDGVKKWESGVMRREDAAKWADVDVTGARSLELVIGDAGDGITGDHADWADAKLLR
ncbi:MAG: NPCBM/NEW2 domain-containing protein [Armatimonadota bacterium]